MQEVSRGLMLNLKFFLSIVAALGVISASLCAPALPYIADHFSADFSIIQFTISLFLIGNACGQFLSGPLSDQIGQRSVLLGGLFLYILSSCSCAIADEMSVLLTARFFQGMEVLSGLCWQGRLPPAIFLPINPFECSLMGQLESALPQFSQY